MKRIAMIAAALFVGGAVGMASAKLPPLSDEQKAKAEEARAKAAEAAKKDAELLAKSQDRAVERYKKKAQVVKTGGAK